MGYESRIYIVRKRYARRNEEMRSSEVISMVDMSKCFSLGSVLYEKPATDCYFYAEDGNTRVVEDRYGRPLTETTLREAIQLVRKSIEVEPDYWRYQVLLATLEAIYHAVGDDPDFAVLHFGY